MKQLEITLHVRNNLLKERRLKAGLSQGQLAKYANVNIAYVNGAECLRKTPLHAIKALANYFDCEPEDLFPESFRLLKNNRALFAKVDVEDLAKLKDKIVDTKRLSNPEQIALQASRGDEIAKALTTLSDQEQYVIKMRFGLSGTSKYTLKETGRILNRSGEMIRYIEARAIRKLRHPSRSRELREVLSV